MYFWRLQQLKAELRRGPLAARPAFGYLIATLIVLTTSVELTAVYPPESYGAHDATLGLGSALLLIAGTYGAYRANGGADGLDFAGRYVALTWVLGVRLLVFGAPIGLLIAVLLGLALAIASPSILESSAFWGWTGTVLLLGWNVLLVLRLVHHFRALAPEPAGTIAGASGRVSEHTAG
jgi:hypothetical protein